MTDGRRRIQAWIALTAWLFVAFSAARPLSAEAYREEAVKAAFLHRFTGYVDWPAEALGGDAFRITVLGAPELAAELGRVLEGRKVKGLPVAIATSLPRSGPHPHLLYVGRGYAGDLGRLLAQHRSHPMLVVTDQPQGLEKGGAINFLLVDQRLRFEVSLEPVQAAGLTMSSQLLAVAVRVLDARSGTGAR